VVHGAVRQFRTGGRVGRQGSSSARTSQRSRHGCGSSGCGCWTRNGCELGELRNSSSGWLV